MVKACGWSKCTQNINLMKKNFFAIQPKNMDSWVWKCILKNRHHFRKGVWWKVGNGLNINFWLDNWCANNSLANLLQVTDHSLIDTSLKVSHFIGATKEWDIAKLNSVVDPVHLPRILAIPLPTNPIPDSICWVCQVMAIFLQRRQLGLHMALTLFISQCGSTIGYGHWISCLSLRFFFGSYVTYHFLPKELYVNED